MMFHPVSDALIDLLNRQGMSAEGLAGPEAQGIGAGLPREDKTDPLTAQAQGGRGEPMGMEKTGAAKAPASALELVSNNAREPSPANGRPVLKLLQGGSNRPSRKSNVRLRLVLTT